MAQQKQLMRATTTFHAPDNVCVREGDLLDVDDALVKKYRKFFVGASETYRRPMEVRHTATAVKEITDDEDVEA